MLSNKKNQNLVVNVHPGYREDSGKDVHYLDDIDPKISPRK